MRIRVCLRDGSDTLSAITSRAFDAITAKRRHGVLPVYAACHTFGVSSDGRRLDNRVFADGPCPDRLDSPADQRFPVIRPRQLQSKNLSLRKKQMTDIKKIKANLESKLKELTARVEEIDDKLSETGDDDSQERAAESQNDEVLEEVGEATQEEILQIKLALSQIEAGRYGICSSCGKAIGNERLEVLPDATKCVKCS